MQQHNNEMGLEMSEQAALLLKMSPFQIVPSYVHSHHQLLSAIIHPRIPDWGFYRPVALLAKSIVLLPIQNIIIKWYWTHRYKSTSFKGLKDVCMYLPNVI